MEKEIRVRFAPSPTGALHIGGVRTALYNYLFAKGMGGKMILRIEDTDQTRFVPGAEEYIKESLEWCGMTLDESPFHGGPHAPYRQSERKPMYMQYAMQLVEAGFAYYAFDTAEELDEMRERLKKANVATPQYNAITRATMKNSLTLPADEVKARLEAGEPYVIRMKIPRKEEVRLNDMIRGWVVVHSSAIDDKVLMKSDGMPTYHLANVVDDYLMKISHVIRGEEWLPSAPLHVLLYKYLGWEDSMPKFAHLPLLLKPDGNGKLSKRDGDKNGYPVFPLDWTDPHTGEKSSGFRERGYLPEAVVNFLALLGWNPGTNDEIFDMDTLVQLFKIERIGKAGAKFDIQKANWFNQHYLRQLPDNVLGDALLQHLKAENIECTTDKAAKIAGLMKERITFAREIGVESAYFFHAPEKYDEQVASKRWTPEAAGVVADFSAALSQAQDIDAENVKETLNTILTAKGLKIGSVLQALRLAVTGVGAGPDLMHIIEILGRDETCNRLTTALQKLGAGK